MPWIARVLGRRLETSRRPRARAIGVDPDWRLIRKVCGLALHGVSWRCGHLKRSFGGEEMSNSQIGDSNFLNVIERGFSWFHVAVLRPINGRVAIPLAFFIGLLYAVFLLGVNTALGTSEFWRLPDGLIGGRIDMKIILSGYYWFVQDEWRWPLMHIGRIHSLDGANAVLFDSVPYVALFGKLVRWTTGYVVNFLPAWIALSFALNAAALAALIRAMGRRAILATLVAGGIGALSPLMHFRFGHIGLAAHWTYIFPMAIYFQWKNSLVTAQVGDR